MHNIFDVGIIGSGVAGTFAVHKISKNYKDIKAIIFDMGRPPRKRRRQMDGFLGCLPSSDGKLYHTDINKVIDICGSRKSKSALKAVEDVFDNICTLKTIKDKQLSAVLEKKLKKNNYEIQLNNYYQLYPKDIHNLSKYISDDFDDNKNLYFCFDTEVFNIIKQKNHFIVTTDSEEYKCKKILICVGRAGWRWVSDLYSNFGIIEDNTFAKFGIRIELPSSYLKDFNKSNCTLILPNELEIGPLSWNGTVIPEDHFDMAISSFRSNEDRWKTDKVSFSFIKNIETENNGYQQTDRIGKLTFILTNDRVSKEKISIIMNNKSKISIIPEYNWLKDDLNNFSNYIPEILTKGYFHVPTIMPIAPKINIGKNLSTEVDDMYVAGESAGIIGLLGAAISGSIAADSICK